MPITVPGTLPFQANNPNSRRSTGGVIGGRLRDSFGEAVATRGGAISGTLSKAIQDDLREAARKDRANSSNSLKDEIDAGRTRGEKLSDLEESLTSVVEKMDETIKIMVDDILTLGEVTDEILEGRDSRDASRDLMFTGVWDRLDAIEDALVQIVTQIKKMHPPTLLDVIFGLFSGQ